MIVCFNGQACTHALRQLHNYAHERHKHTGPHYNDQNRGSEHIRHNNSLFPASSVKDKNTRRAAKMTFKKRCPTIMATEWKQIAYSAVKRRDLSVRMGILTK